MSRFLYENHRGSPTLILLNVLGVMDVLNVLNALHVLNVLHVLHVLNMLMDASLACWALFRCVLASLYEVVSVGRSDGRLDGRMVTRFF